MLLQNEVIEDTLQLEIDAFIDHVNKIKVDGKPLVFWIDLFCGAGGTSTGIQFANVPNMFVAACVNHDANAIKSHKENHPDTLHFTEDIRDFDVVLKLKRLCDELRTAFPGCTINIWASLECTNFSKAKGGLPRDADSRTLADHMFMYLQLLDPDYFWVENVREFMAWGPLDANGKPLSREAGHDYMKWIESVKAYGFQYSKQILNAADFGAYQSRQRLFIQFAKHGLPVSWPEPTHSKKATANSLFGMSPWKAVKEVLDLLDEGVSIFRRKKPLTENTLKRIYAGLIKFVANGQDTFTKRYNGGSVGHEAKANSINVPMGTILTNNTHALVKSVFLKKYFSGRPEGKVIGIDGPAGTVKCRDGQAMVTASHLQTYYGNGGLSSIETAAPCLTTKDRIAKVDAKFLVDYQYNSSARDIDSPSPTLLTKDKFAIVSTNQDDAFLMNQYSGGGEYTDINNPSGSVTTTPKQNLVTLNPWIMNTSFTNVGKSIDEPANTLLASRKHPYLVSLSDFVLNPGWGGNNSSTEDPCCTVVARQDKAPLYYVKVEEQDMFVFDGEGFLTDEDYQFIHDQENGKEPSTEKSIRLKIVEFMFLYGISDIKMRMLKMPELKQIQGFPKDYKLIGTQTEQKKYIGNAVEVRQASALTQENYRAIEKHYKTAA